MQDMKKIGPNLKDIRLKLNKNWIPVWLKKPTDFRPTTKMPNFRLNDRADSGDLGVHLAVVVHGSFAQAKARQCRTRQGIVRKSRLHGLPLHGRRRRRGGRSLCRQPYARRRERPITITSSAGCTTPGERTRPYCPYEKKDIGPEDYAKKGLPTSLISSTAQCPNDGHELQVQNMTVMPSLRLSLEDAQDIASYLIPRRRQEPSAYADASYMDDPQLKEEGEKWVRHFGCAGCHEISGFEDEGRIGTELTVEGSKPIERLDFALFTETALRGGKASRSRQRRSGASARRPIQEPVVRPQGILRTQDGRAQHLRQGQGRQKPEEEKLRMPNLHLTKEQIRALTTFLLGSEETSLPAELSVQAGRCAERYSGRLVGGQEVQLHGMPSVYSQPETPS